MENKGPCIQEEMVVQWYSTPLLSCYGSGLKRTPKIFKVVLWDHSISQNLPPVPSICSTLSRRLHLSDLCPAIFTIVHLHLELASATYYTCSQVVDSNVKYFFSISMPPIHCWPAHQRTELRIQSVFLAWLQS